MIGTLKTGQTYVFPYEGQIIFTVPGSRAGDIFGYLGQNVSTSVAVTRAIRRLQILKPAYKNAAFIVHKCFDKPWDGKTYLR